MRPLNQSVDSQVRVKKLISLQTVAKRSKDLAMREGTLQEIVHVEQTYLEVLSDLINSYFIPLRAYFVSWCGSSLDPNGWCNLEFNSLFNAALELERVHKDAFELIEGCSEDENRLGKAFQLIAARQDACSRCRV